MSEPTLYRIDQLADDEDRPQEVWQDRGLGYKEFVGVLVPVEPDYETAKVPATDTFAMFASKMLGISHEEAMQRDDVQEAGAIITAATIQAALGIGDNDAG